MQNPIHEGYEYQDYFTVSIILQLMLHQTDAELIIDRKDCLLYTSPSPRDS